MHQDPSRLLFYYIQICTFKGMPVRKTQQTLDNSGTKNSGRITATTFNQQGNILAVGDQGGDICFYRRNQNNVLDCVGEFSTLKSHVPCRKSEGKVASIDWMEGRSGVTNLLTSNGSSIRVWRLKQSQNIYYPGFSDNSLFHSKSALPAISCDLSSQMTLSSSSLHLSYLNDLIISQNGHSITLTNLQNKQNVLQIPADDVPRPPIAPQFCKESKTSYEERIFSETQYWNSIDSVTSAKFQGLFSDRMAYSDKAGLVSYFDLRKSQNVRPVAKLGIPRGKTTVQCCLNVISDFVFLDDDRSIVTRDFLYVYQWDLRNPKTYTGRRSIFPSINSQICQFYQQCEIYNRFSLRVNSSGSKVFTNHFQQSFHELDMESQSNIRYKSVDDAIQAEMVTGALSEIPPLYATRVLQCLDYNEKTDTVCTGVGSTLRLFSSP